MSDYRWSPRIKNLVLAAALVLFGIIVYVLWPLLPIIAMAAVLAFLLLPLVERLAERGVHRGLATGLVFLVLVVLILLIPIILVPAFIDTASTIDLGGTVTTLVTTLHNMLEGYREVTIGGNPVDLSTVIDPIQDRLRDLEAGQLPDLAALFGAVTGFAGRTLSTVAGLLGTLVIVLITAFYLVLDAPHIRHGAWSYIPEDARPEVKVLAARLNGIWGAFFRGQLFLGTVVGVATALGGFAIGLPGALWLGLIAGVLEVVPNVGPVLSAVPAIIVALVYGSSWLPVERSVFLLITVGLYVIIQQLENNLLVPRIIGNAVGLPPVVVLLGAIVGATLAGLLGVFLAAPVIASLALLARYAYNKLLDRPPFEDMPGTAEASPTLAEAEAAVVAEAHAADVAAAAGEEEREAVEREQVGQTDPEPPKS